MPFAYDYVGEDRLDVDVAGLFADVVGAESGGGSNYVREQIGDVTSEVVEDRAVPRERHPSKG